MQNTPLIQSTSSHTPSPSTKHTPLVPSLILLVVESSKLTTPSNAMHPSSHRKRCRRKQHVQVSPNIKVNARSSSSLHAKIPLPLILSSRPHAFVAGCQTFNAASLACTLFITSGSGAGSTLAGAARGQDSHFGCWQRTHSGGAASAAALPSSESGCGTGG